LRRFLTDLVKADYDWMKPDRRFLPEDIIIPDIGDEEAAGEIVVVVDTSGSIDDEMLTAFASEFTAIHRDLKPTTLHVMYCDAKVHKHDQFSPEDTVIIQRQGIGGGGTSFVHPFLHLLEKRIQPKALVYLTDLYGDHYDRTPDFPVLWACWSPCEDIPFGELITVRD
jgi:predicted metal-dependent peptidase